MFGLWMKENRGSKNKDKNMAEQRCNRIVFCTANDLSYLPNHFTLHSQAGYINWSKFIDGDLSIKLEEYFYYAQLK